MPLPEETAEKQAEKGMQARTRELIWVLMASERTRYWRDRRKVRVKKIQKDSLSEKNACKKARTDSLGVACHHEKTVTKWLITNQSRQSGRFVFRKQTNYSISTPKSHTFSQLGRVWPVWTQGGELVRNQLSRAHSNEKIRTRVRNTGSVSSLKRYFSTDD